MDPGNGLTIMSAMRLHVELNGSYIYTTHCQVYTHRKAKSIEFMLADAMLEANKVSVISAVTMHHLLTNTLVSHLQYLVHCLLAAAVPF